MSIEVRFLARWAQRIGEVIWSTSAQMITKLTLRLIVEYYVYTYMRGGRRIMNNGTGRRVSVGVK